MGGDRPLLHHCLLRISGQHIGIQVRIPSVCRLRAEEDDSRQTDATEDSNQVERPPPHQGVRDLAHDDGREGGAAEHGKVGEGHADPALVDGVQVGHGGADQGLEGRAPDALDDPGPEEAPVVLLAARDAAPGARGGQHRHAEDEGVPLPPDAARRHEKGAGGARAQQEVSCQEGDVGEVVGHVQRDGDGVGGEDGAEGGREYG